nr:MAG TPA: putative tRNA pseudouridine synthase B [Caudoviricetes sp.]
MKRIRKLTNWLISKLKSCPHKHKELRTLAHYCTVEVTALFCKDCGKQLTKEEWNV